MIDSDIIWNIGGWNTYLITANQFYEKERGTNTLKNFSAEWSKKTDVGEKHNGIGLMYPSDYGYAVGGKVRQNCLTKNLLSYPGDCSNNNWLKKNNINLWTLMHNNEQEGIIFGIISDGSVNNLGVAGKTTGAIPVCYLKSSFKIYANLKIEQEYGSIDNPFILE